MKLTPPNNTALPELNGFAARSFWLQLLTVIAMILNSQGIDIWATLREAGIGGNPAQVLATGDRIVAIWQQALPIVTGIWAYLERRAPHYRLVWPWKWGRVAGIAGLLALFLALSPSGAMAQMAPLCADRATVTQGLAENYGEQALGGGIADNQQLVEVFTNVATGSWTVLVSRADGVSCLIASGQGWVSAPADVAMGDPT